LSESVDRCAGATRGLTSPIGPSGFRHLAGYLGLAEQVGLLKEIRSVIAEAPLFAPTMPRTGKPFSVRMTNCGPLGWVSDKVDRYRYQATHPGTGLRWPELPKRLLALWDEVTGLDRPPEACLINHYAHSAKMGSHRDEDEEDRAAPVVSISLGDDATFHIGGLKRSDPKQRLLLRSGDVVVLGGNARLAYHGVDRIHAGTSDLLPEGGRFNLTLRRVTVAAR
jgi:alkylated DNA repair protein (DNA oxidative demethylase)